MSRLTQPSYCLKQRKNKNRRAESGGWEKQNADQLDLTCLMNMVYIKTKTIKLIKVLIQITYSLCKNIIKKAFKSADSNDFFVLLHRQFCSLRACWLGETSIVVVDMFVSEVSILVYEGACVCVCVCAKSLSWQDFALCVILPNRTIRDQDCYPQSRPSFIWYLVTTGHRGRDMHCCCC